MFSMRKIDCIERSDDSGVDLNDYDEETGELIMLTKQEFKDECDVNKILENFARTGRMDAFNAHGGQYGDFSDVMSYQDAQNAIIAADEAFMALPADIRKRFNNSPAEFLDFVDNDDNLEEAEKLGLLVNKGVESPTSVSLDVTGGTDTASV